MSNDKHRGIPNRIPLDEKGRRETNENYYDLLQAVLFSWEQRDYQQTQLGMEVRRGTDGARFREHNSFTEINERRQAERLKVLKSLKSWYETKRFFTDAQRAMIEKMARNAKVKKSEVNKLMEKKREVEAAQKREGGGGELDFPIENQVPSSNAKYKAPTVAGGSTGHESDEARWEAGRKLLDEIVKSDSWPEQIGDRDFEFLNGLVDREADGRIDRLSVKQWFWLKDCYDDYVCGIPRRGKIR